MLQPAYLGTGNTQYHLFLEITTISVRQNQFKAKRHHWNNAHGRMDHHMRNDAQHLAVMNLLAARVGNILGKHSKAFRKSINGRGSWIVSRISAHSSLRTADITCYSVPAMDNQLILPWSWNLLSWHTWEQLVLSITIWSVSNFPTPLAAFSLEFFARFNT